MATRRQILKKGKLGLWKITNKGVTIYRITDDGCGFCNSIEEMSSYYLHGTEIELVKEILHNGNKILFENIVSGESATYEEYLEQFKKNGDFLIVPYINFETYEQALRIWERLSGTIKKINTTNKGDNNMSEYTISGRKTKDVMNSIINTLMGYYQVNKEVMEQEDKIKTLEDIVDLIKINKNI